MYTRLFKRWKVRLENNMITKLAWSVKKSEHDEKSLFCFLLILIFNLFFTKQRRLLNAAKKALEKIPTKTIRQNDLINALHGEFTECCAVCIELFKISDVVRLLPCK